MMRPSDADISSSMDCFAAERQSAAGAEVGVTRALLSPIPREAKLRWEKVASRSETDEG
jgi:hypothetical protein